MFYKLNVIVYHRRPKITSKNNPWNQTAFEVKGPLPFFLESPSQLPKALFTFIILLAKFRHFCWCLLNLKIFESIPGLLNRNHRIGVGSFHLTLIVIEL